MALCALSEFVIGYLLLLLPVLVLLPKSDKAIGTTDVKLFDYVNKLSFRRKVHNSLELSKPQTFYYASNLLEILDNKWKYRTQKWGSYVIKPLLVSNKVVALILKLNITNLIVD